MGSAGAKKLQELEARISVLEQGAKVRLFTSNNPGKPVDVALRDVVVSLVKASGYSFQITPPAPPAPGVNLVKAPLAPPSPPISAAKDTPKRRKKGG